jgi:hypothetical protein
MWRRKMYELDCNVDNGGKNGDVPELRRSEHIKKNILRIMQPVLITLTLTLTIYQ